MTEPTINENCSGIVKVDCDHKRCKHGFPLTPFCNNDPMRPGAYRSVPCLSEAWTSRLYPDTGKPNMTTSEPD